jgi:GWxTD domain-containing protein
MRKEPVRRLLKSTFFTLFSIFFYFACASVQIRDSYYYDFYEKARLLMTEEEDETYRHLPDAAAKERFINTFWETRDPDSLTEENEFRDEFQERIEFANENFGFPAGTPNRETSRGWNTDRGRIYLVLGPPDWMHTIWREKEPEAVVARDASGNPEVPKEWIREEHWHYQEHHLTLVFMLHRRHWTLESAPPDLLHVMEEAKREMISPANATEAEFGFRFSLRYEDRCVRVDIPVRGVQYAEKDGKLRALFEVSVQVMKEGTLVRTLRESKEFLLSEGDLLDLRHLEIRMPYVPPGPGEYLLQVTVEDALDPMPEAYQKSLTIKGFWLAR